MVIKPERAATILLMLVGYLETRHHTGQVEAESEDRGKVMFARTVQLERRADSLWIRVKYLERKVKALGPHPRRHRGYEEPETLGPPYEKPKGELMQAIGKAFKGLFFWARSES